MATDRLDVRKTYKLYVGGKFPRSESGRTYPVVDTKDQLLAHAARSSRKDVRDAVVAARGAQPGWAGTTAYNRSQILCRVAEMMEGRREQFITEVAHAEGLTTKKAATTIDAAIDRWVWYAGWADKFQAVAGTTNPVAGPYFDISVPEPTGVVAAIAPQHSSLLGLVAVLAPIIVSGNTLVLAASEPRPLPAITLAEILATSDVPPGVVNILTGHTHELAPILAAHLDINAIDLTGATHTDTTALSAAAAENIKRILPTPPHEPTFHTPPPSPRRILAFCETKTIWHPKGT